MATYISATSGKWDASDADTWGQGIGVYPALADDVSTISVGHTVTYNIISAVVLGKISVYGTLKFSRSVDSELTLSTDEANQLVVYSGGMLDMGTIASPIPAGVTAIISCDTTDLSNNSDYSGPRRPQQGVRVLYGGTISVVGDSDYYGGTAYAPLASNWTSGQSFTVTGDVSGWNQDDVIVVANPWATGIAQKFSRKFTVASANYANGETTVTINEEFPEATGPAPFRGLADFNILNMSRNVKLRRVGTKWRRWVGNLYDEEIYDVDVEPPMPGGVTVYGSGDAYTSYPTVERPSYVNFHEAEFDTVALYSGDYKYVHNCSFRGAGIWGCYDVGSGWGTPPSPPVQSSKITNNFFWLCQTGVDWHRNCGGNDGLEFSGNIFSNCWTGIGILRDSKTDTNTYPGCYTAVAAGIKTVFSRWWPGITDDGPTMGDDFIWCRIGVGNSSDITLIGTFDHCIIGMYQVQRAAVSGDVTNVVQFLNSCSEVTFTGDISLTYCWMHADHAVGADGYNTNERNAALDGYTQPMVVRNSNKCTFTNSVILSPYSVEGGGIFHWGGNYEDCNVYDNCAITCLTLFAILQKNMWSMMEAPTVCAKFDTCLISQNDDGGTPAWTYGVRHLAIPAISATHGSNAIEDTYVEFDTCTVIESLGTSEFPAVIREHPMGRDDYTVYEITVYNGTETLTTYPLSRAVRIVGEGDHLATVHKFYGTLQDIDTDLNNDPAPDPTAPPTLSVVATPKVSDDPTKTPMNFRIIELTENDVPVLPRQMRCYAKLDANWGATPPTAAELRLEVQYPTGNLGVATAYSTEQVTTDWTALSVEITPGAVGTVRSRLVLYTGDGSASVIVDPAIYLGAEE